MSEIHTYQKSTHAGGCSFVYIRAIYPRMARFLAMLMGPSCI